MVGATQIAQLLVEQGGADVEAKDGVSCSILCIASVCSHPDTNTTIGSV